ncbi:MAG: SDR family oxidoreductase [Minisyncoccia bacterium]
MNTEPQAIVVTGMRGLLGSTLLRTKIDGGNPVGFASDITDRDAISAEVNSLKPRWIIHAAAMTDVGACERDPAAAREVNVEGTKKVVDSAHAAGASLMYISTVSVFSGREGNYTEGDTPEPMNVYNTTKRDGELAVLAYEKGMVLRLNLIGVHPDGSRGKNFMEWLIDSINANKDMTLFNDQFINPLSNWTVAATIKTLIEREVTEKILHIGSSNVLSKAEIATLALARFSEYRGTVVQKSIDSIADGVPRPKQMWLNCDTASGIMGSGFPDIGSEIEIILNSFPLALRGHSV